MMRSAVRALPAVAAAVVGLGVFASTSARAAVVLSDSFAYGDGNLVGQGSWAQTGTSTATPIQVASGAAVLGTSGQDAYEPFASAVSNTPGGSLLTSFDATVTAAQAAGDYFLHLSNPAGTTSNFYERIFAKSTTGGYLLGLSDQTGTAVYGTDVLTTGTSYHVVAEWDFVSGDKNDTFKVYVNPTDPVLSNNTPYLSYTWTSTASEPAALAAANLRQGTGSNAANVTLDNLAVEYVAPVPEPASLSVVGLGAAALVGRRRRVAR